METVTIEETEKYDVIGGNGAVSFLKIEQPQAILWALAGYPEVRLRDQAGKDVTDQLINPGFIDGKLTIPYEGNILVITKDTHGIDAYSALLDRAAIIFYKGQLLICPNCKAKVPVSQLCDKCGVSLRLSNGLLMVPERRKKDVSGFQPQSKTPPNSLMAQAIEAAKSKALSHPDIDVYDEIMDQYIALKEEQANPEAALNHYAKIGEVQRKGVGQ